MKRAGIIIFAIGLLITVFTGFNYVTKEKIVDLGDIQITADKKHSVDWSPYAGVAVMIVGGVVFLVGRKDS
ncbi:MAG: hypothetical protein EA364_01355 [Balneolaceae bacterium]|nr:MAG: hypothetical protein EA364_01355 [Balneolaceae bacterium]